MASNSKSNRRMRINDSVWQKEILRNKRMDRALEKFGEAISEDAIKRSKGKYRNPFVKADPAKTRSRVRVGFQHPETYQEEKENPDIDPGIVLRNREAKRKHLLRAAKKKREF